MNVKCPICKKPVDSKANREFPFCSERCRLQDLGNWSAERYLVSEPVFDEEEPEDGPRPRSRGGGADGDEPDEV